MKYGAGRGASRGQRVAEEIQRALGMYFIEGRVKDERVDGVPLTVTFIQMSDDLQHAKVYLRTLGAEKVSPECLEGLNECSYRIKKDIARELKLRYTPELAFFEDEHYDRATRIMELIDSVSHKGSGEGQKS